MSPITDRLDGWVRSRSAVDRLVRIGEAVAGCCSLAVLGGVVARFAVPDATWAHALTAPTALTAALAYGVANVVSSRQSTGIAGDARLRPGLGDALQAALGKTPRDDLEAIISGALDPERIQQSVARTLEGETLSKRIEAIAEQMGDEMADIQIETDAALADLVETLANPGNRRMLSRWLGQLLYEERELVTDFGRAVAKKSAPKDVFDIDLSPSRGKMYKAVRRFIESRRGEVWADDAVGRALTDLRDVPPRAEALRRVLMPEVAKVASRHLADVIGPKLSDALGHESGLVDDVAAAVRADVEPALMGALAQAVEAQAAKGTEYLDGRALAALVRRAAEPTARRLQFAAFVAGGILGALPTAWS